MHEQWDYEGNVYDGCNSRKKHLKKICCWKFAAGSSSKFPAAGPVHRDTKAVLTDNLNLCTYNENMKVMYVTGASPEKNVFKKICCWKFAAGTSSCWIQWLEVIFPTSWANYFENFADIVRAHFVPLWTSPSYRDRGIVTWRGFI